MLNSRDDNQTVGVRDPHVADSAPVWPPAGQARPELVVRDDSGRDAARRARGIKDFASGALLIAVGFAFGGSVFLGNPGPLDWVFDSLGALWICKGVWEIWTS